MSIDPARILKIIDGRACPNCGSPTGFDLKSIYRGYHHNKCGHIEETSKPWPELVQEHIDKGYLELKSGDGLIAPWEVKPGMEMILKDSQKTSKDGCFVATTIYGSHDAYEVLIFREFRDTVLLRNFVGSIFVAIYYSLSPILIRMIGNNTKIRDFTKFLLDRIVARLQ